SRDARASRSRDRRAPLARRAHRSHDRASAGAPSGARPARFGGAASLASWRARTRRRTSGQAPAHSSGRWPRAYAHFRMTGDWVVGRGDDPLPRFARAVLTLDDGSRVVLDDPRALSTLDLHPAGAPLGIDLGPEPSDRSLTARSLHTALAKRRG